MRTFIAFLIVALSYTSSGQVLPDECDLNLLCLGMKAGDAVADPYDCKTYYFCYEDSTCPDTTDNIVISDSLDCPSGQVFNPNVNITACEDEGSTPCQPICPNYYCRRDCPAEPTCKITLIPDPDDCSVFYQCLPSGPQPQTCPSEKPFFDGLDCSAGFRNETCCPNLCTPYCNEDDFDNYVMDPYDCKKKYYCLGEGIPTIENSCSGGEVFDAESVTGCSPGESCEPYCSTP